MTSVDVCVGQATPLGNTRLPVISVRVQRILVVARKGKEVTCEIVTSVSEQKKRRKKSRCNRERIA